VTGGGVPNDEMPNILRPGRRDVPPLIDAALAALLAGTEPPAEPAPGLQPVADVLAALRAGPTSDELAGEARALAEFRRGTGVPALPRRSRHRKRQVPASRLRVKVAAAVGVAALGLAGLASAAFTGVLPTPVQRLAHDAVGAPSASSGSPVTSQLHRAKRRPPASPGAIDPAAHTAVPPPCAAYARASANGSPAQRAAAFRDLIRAAGGVGKLTAYCGRAMPLPGGLDPRPPYSPDGRVRPGRHHDGLQRDRDGRGIPSGGRRGHHRPHSNDKPRAHLTGRGRHRHPHAPGHGAHLNPHATELSPARS
jgi:hypothetical protein